MATIVTNLTCELTGAVQVKVLQGNLFSADNAGNTINVFVTNHGQPATLGGTISANVIRGDGTTVAVSGAIDGNRAYIILPQACYAVPGVIQIIIKNTESSTVTTIAAVVANVYESTTDTVVDPGTIIPSVASLVEAIEDAVAEIPAGYNACFAPAYSTSSTYALGQYVTYSGYLYRCTTAITSSESWTAAHWTQVALANDVSALKSAFDDTNNTIKNYLVESNLLHKESSLVVGDTGQTYQQKDFYTIEKNFVAGEKYTFSCDSVVGYTTTPMRYKVMNGDTKIRDAGQAQTLYLEITSEDVTAGANKVVFFVYASTSVAQSQPCVLTNPVVYLGWTTEEQITYTENFDNEVNRIIEQSTPELETIQTLNLGTLEDGYINSASGAAVSGSSYKRTGFIHVQANKLKVAITFSVADVGFAFYDSRKKYISGFDYTGYNVGDLKEVTVPENAYYFRYCAINANVPLMLVLIPNYANAVSRIDTNPCFYDVSSECRTFKKILCIGDSLTAGQFDYKEGGVTKEFNAPEYSYPTFLKALTGRDITNAGDAGETTVSWYELHGQEDFSGHDACIIMLGRNDYVSGRETTSEQRATAFANIIAKVRLDNPQIPIFMATLINYYKGDAAETMNEDIRTAATANNCYLLDIAAYGRMVLADDAYSHCTAEGYYTLAEYFFRYISYIMHNNYTSFKTIQFVGTNRAY